MGMTLKELLTKGEGTLTAGEAKTLRTTRQRRTPQT